MISTPLIRPSLIARLLGAPRTAMSADEAGLRAMRRGLVARFEYGVLRAVRLATGPMWSTIEVETATGVLTMPGLNKRRAHILA